MIASLNVISLKLSPVFAILMFTISCGIDLNNKSRQPIDLSPSQFKLRTTSDRFKGCRQLQANFYRQLSAKKRFDQTYERLNVKSSSGRVASAAETSSSNDKSVSNNFTNVQEQGVDEADTTKISEHHIFVAANSKLEVVDRHKLSTIATMKFKRHILGMYVDDDRLHVLTGNSSSLVCGMMQSSRTPEYVEIRTYKLTANERPLLLHKQKILGTYYASRAQLGKIYVVTQSEIPYVDSVAQHIYDLKDTAIPREPLDLRSISEYGWSCEDIMQQPVEDAVNTFAAIHVIDPAEPNGVVQRVGLLGSADFIYMGQDQFVASRLAYSANPWSYEIFSDGTYEIRTLMVSFTVNRDLGELGQAAAAGIDGYALGSWAVKDFPGEAALAVMTTTGNSWNTSPRTKLQNHLSILKKSGDNLMLQAQIRNFGSGESIHAVRYIDRIAYAVTFRQTDPLFAFDLSDLSKPRKLGELHIPGFSTYLHPVGAGRLLGVGFNADSGGSREGMQVSLFDTGNPKDLQQLTRLNIGGTSSYSAANYDHHAFFYSSTRAITAFPVNDCSFKGDSYECKSSAYIVRVGSDTLDRVASIDHSSLYPYECMSSCNAATVSRIFEVDDHLISISSLGIQQHSFSDLTSPAKVLRFPQNYIPRGAVVCSHDE